MNHRHLMSILFSTLLLSSVVGAANTPAADARPTIRFDNERFVSSPVLEGDAVIHDFMVENVGNARLSIERVRAG